MNNHRSSEQTCDSGGGDLRDLYAAILSDPKFQINQEVAEHLDRQEAAARAAGSDPGNWRSDARNLAMSPSRVGYDHASSIRRP
jgi:hypothetical protein